MRFLISYTGNLILPAGERPKARLEEISTLGELLALFHAEEAKQPEDFRGLILMDMECEAEYPDPVLRRLSRTEWPQFKLEVYDYYRE